jgi:hypothetical protein
MKKEIDFTNADKGKFSADQATKFNLPEEKIYYVDCDCRNEILRLELIKDEGVSSLDLAIYTYGSGEYKVGFMQKLRYIFKILKDGSPHGDCMILQKEGILKLKECVDDIVKNINL